jgi:hypothetical protein
MDAQLKPSVAQLACAERKPMSMSTKRKYEAEELRR